MYCRRIPSQRRLAAYEIRLEPEQLLPSGDDRASAVGRYRGVERATGRRVDAASAHVFKVRDGRIALSGR